MAATGLTMVLWVWLCLVPLSNSETYSYDNNFKAKLFPRIEVTLANDYKDTIYYMCKGTERSDKLYPLVKGETFRFNFTQIAFPMKWCFLYINSRTHGFLWVYNMRSRCTKCFWSITNFPNLYRTDRVRWERQKLFLPLGFKIKQYFSDNANPWA